MKVASDDIISFRQDFVRNIQYFANATFDIDNITYLDLDAVAQFKPSGFFQSIDWLGDSFQYFTI